MDAAPPPMSETTSMSTSPKIRPASNWLLRVRSFDSASNRFHFETADRARRRCRV
jgi:hypothetical protein